MDTASASNAVCVWYNVISQGFDWINFWINMGGNIVAGLLSGWFVTWTYRKRDFIEANRRKKTGCVGCAMEISIKVDTALQEDCRSGYQKLQDAIFELSTGISGIKFEYEKEDDSNQYIDDMREKMSDIINATSELIFYYRHKENKDDFYGYKGNKDYVDGCIEVNKKELKRASDELFEIARRFNDYIGKSNLKG